MIFIWDVRDLNAGLGTSDPNTTCRLYRNKRKDYNSQTQQYFYGVLKIYCNI